LSPVLETARRLALAWGLHCVVRGRRHLDDMVDRACRISFREGFAKPGQRIIITAGVPLRHARVDQHAAHRLYRKRRQQRPLRAAHSGSNAGRRDK
jgi:pyruvate kinase